MHLAKNIYIYTYRCNNIETSLARVRKLLKMPGTLLIAACAIFASAQDLELHFKRCPTLTVCSKRTAGNVSGGQLERRYVMLCSVMSYHIISCHVMLCSVCLYVCMYVIAPPGRASMFQSLRTFARARIEKIMSPAIMSALFVFDFGGSQLQGYRS